MGESDWPFSVDWTQQLDSWISLLRRRLLCFWSMVGACITRLDCVERCEDLAWTYLCCWPCCWAYSFSIAWCLACWRLTWAGWTLLWFAPLNGFNLLEFIWRSTILSFGLLTLWGLARSNLTYSKMSSIVSLESRFASHAAWVSITCGLSVASSLNLGWICS